MIPSKLEMLLADRDRARAANDVGLDRAITADLRRMGVADDATYDRVTRPQQQQRASRARNGALGTLKGRQVKPKCEHGRPPERCEDCRIEEESEVRDAISA